jgi:hypothetical protein
MEKLLQEEFLSQTERQLEDQLNLVISVFQNLPEDTLQKPALNNGWSIAECLAHLNSYAEFYQPRITKAIDKASPIEASGVFKHSFLGRYFITSMDPDLSKKKFKAMKKHTPVKISNPDIVVSTFIQHLENMLSILTKAKHKNLRKTSVPISISPLLKINPGDALVFLLTHNRRHLEQAKRNLAR